MWTAVLLDMARVLYRMIYSIMVTHMAAVRGQDPAGPKMRYPPREMMKEKKFDDRMINPYDILYHGYTYVSVKDLSRCFSLMDRSGMNHRSPLAFFYAWELDGRLDAMI